MRSEILRHIEDEAGPRMNPDELIKAAKQIPPEKQAEISQLLHDVIAELDQAEQAEQTEH